MVPVGVARFDILAAGLFQFSRISADVLGRTIGRLGASPGAFVATLLSASVLAYLPLALVFGPWDWVHIGPFSFQLCRPLHYLVYFLAGAGVGAYGADRGLLAPDGWLAKRWALAFFLHFAHRRLPVLEPLGDKTYGIYLIHYVFSIWLQYALLGLAIFAGVKAVIVFIGKLSMSFVSVAALRRIPLASRINRSRRGLTT